MITRWATLLLWLAVCTAAAETAAPGVRQAETEAEVRHTRAVRDCGGAADYAVCVRDADAQLNDTLRGLAGERLRGATPPGTPPSAAPRVQGERLMRDLEQSAPRPLPPPPAGPDPPYR
jgi:hypothetical protein